MSRTGRPVGRRGAGPGWLVVPARLAAIAGRYDVLLLTATLSAALLGIVMVASATRASAAGSGTFVVRQAVWVVLGLAVMAATMAADLDVVRRLAPVSYALAGAALVAVLSPLGTSANGTQAWFDAGPLRLQPAELAKPVLIVALAAHGHRAADGLRGGRLIGALLLAGPLVALVLLQPDLGTAAVLAVVTAGVVVLAGAPARQVGLVALTGLVVVAGALRMGMLAPYQLDRLSGFVDQSADPQGVGWNLEQAKIAIGSGGIAGRGLFAGTQTSLAYVPEQHTDFVFTVVGEELGLAGGATLLGLFAVIAWRIWRAAWLARSRFGALCCAGALTMLVFQVFQNVGMTIGVMPITGIPLPFVSYGGSSTIACFAVVGLVANVSGAPREVGRLSR